jgi:hypothetical protein
MDPHALLGLPAGASADEAARAYRRLAKRWHPDRAGAAAAARMAEINAAYELFRAAERGVPVAAQPPPPPAGRPAPGAWLPGAVRRALGHELLSVLEDGEAVALVTPASTWASPSTLLAVTDRRLLWLLDDAVGHRVRFLRHRDIAGVEHALTWPLRRRARVRVLGRYGQRWTFADLRPATAAAIAAAVRRAG